VETLELGFEHPESSIIEPNEQVKEKYDKNGDKLLKTGRHYY